jgi:DNA ligase-1
MIESEVSVEFIIKEWPVIQSKARTGKAKFWQIRVLESRETGDVLIEVEWWQDAGAHQRQSKKIKGKNIGRSNATSPTEQALAEAQAEFTKQHDKGYSVDGKANSSYCLPMLAQDFKARKNAITFPCCGQPKLDGVRCLFHPQLGFWSRHGKPFNAVDLSRLRWDSLEYVTLDGELILPAPYTFQQTVSAVKKQNDLTPLLEYHVFDAVIMGPFHSRLKSLQQFETDHASDKPEKLFIVPTVHLYCQSDVEAWLADYLRQGYEGLILRNYEGEYEIGHRSPELQKYKEFIDAEYEIIGVEDGLGKEEGVAIFICQTAQGQVFKTRPRGTYDARRVMFQNRENYFGKWLTVRYQNLTDDGIPRFPVGRDTREMIDGQPAL